jgi:hypothetical protein
MHTADLKAGVLVDVDFPPQRDSFERDVRVIVTGDGVWAAKTGSGDHYVGDTGPVGEQQQERYRLVVVVMCLMVGCCAVAGLHFRRRVGGLFEKKLQLTCSEGSEYELFRALEVQWKNDRGFHGHWRIPSTSGVKVVK